MVMMNRLHRDGKEIPYGDCVHHDLVITGFTLWDRIKILFGRKVVVMTQIYVKNNQVCVVHSDSTVAVRPLFPRRIKGGWVSPREVDPNIAKLKKLFKI